MSRSRKADGSDRRARTPGFAEAAQPMLADEPVSLAEQRLSTILHSARSAGMMQEKTARISGRVSPVLIAQAKQRTGITSDSELIEFALASLALDDDFATVLARVRGTVDPDIQLGYWLSAFDVDAALRWLRFNGREQLKRRTDDALPFLAGSPTGGQALLLDTCVYIDDLQARLPESVVRLIAARHVNHSTVALQELMHGLGALDPRDHRTPDVTARVATVIRGMRPHRMFTPDAEILGRAAFLSGLLCRSQNYAGDHRKRALMDSTLFLQAQKLGLAVVTRNIADFDLLLQLIPRVSVYLYRN